MTPPRTAKLHPAQNAVERVAAFRPGAILYQAVCEGSLGHGAPLNFVGDVGSRGQSGVKKGLDSVSLEPMRIAKPAVYVG